MSDQLRDQPLKMADIRDVACEHIAASVDAMRDANTPPEVDYWLRRIALEVALLDKMLSNVVARPHTDNQPPTD